MKPDLSLLNLHHGLCEAVERNGAICFGKKHAKGFCHKHYERFKKNGSVSLLEKVNRKCKFIDCRRKYFSCEYCKFHYQQHYHKNKKSKIKCSVDDCMNVRRSKGLCSTHLGRLKKHGNIHTVLSRGVNEGYIPPWTGKSLGKKCIVPGCDYVYNGNNRVITKGLCGKHYQRWRIHGDYNMSLINRECCK